MRVRRWCAKGGWGPWTNHSSPLRGLDELVVVKLELMIEATWPMLPFKCNLWCARDKLKTRHMNGLLDIMPVMSCQPSVLVKEAGLETLL